MVCAKSAFFLSSAQAITKVRNIATDMIVRTRSVLYVEPMAMTLRQKEGGGGGHNVCTHICSEAPCASL
jgi:hypothetical protein